MMTRPDIAFHTAHLAKVMQRPSNEALNAALNVVAYLKKTRMLGITYDKRDSMELWSDSSFGRSPKPMGGHAVIYGGAALSWSARALKIVPLSSAEAETAVLSLGSKDMMYVKQLVATLRPGKAPQEVEAYVDNTATIDIVKAQGVTARTKHFERWVSYVRDLYQRYIIRVNHVSTDEMPADLFTKALPRVKFEKFRAFLLNTAA
jgi:hypothetical protein